MCKKFQNVQEFGSKHLRTLAIVTWLNIFSFIIHVFWENFTYYTYGCTYIIYMVTQTFKKMTYICT